MTFICKIVKIDSMVQFRNMSGSFQRLILLGFFMVMLQGCEAIQLLNSVNEIIKPNGNAPVLEQKPKSATK